MRFYCEDKEAALQEVQSTAEGLSSEEAARRLEFEEAAQLRDAIMEIRSAAKQ